MLPSELKRSPPQEPRSRGSHGSHRPFLGMDVTETMPLMQAAGERQQGATTAKKRRLEEAAGRLPCEGAQDLERTCESMQKPAGKVRRAQRS